MSRHQHTRLSRRLSELRKTRFWAPEMVSATSRAACQHANVRMHGHVELQIARTWLQLRGCHTSIFRRVKKAGFCWRASPMSLALSACSTGEHQIKSVLIAERLPAEQALVCRLIPLRLRE